MAVSAATLRTLHRIHRQLSDLRSRLARGPKQIQAGEAHVTRLNQLRQSAKDDVKKTTMLADQKELQLKEREMRIEDVRGKLNACSTNREYQAFIEQIAADEQANSVLSDEILELYDKMAQLQDGVKRHEEQLAKGKTDIEKLRQKIDGEKQSLETDLARLSNELVEAEASLPAEATADYNRVVKVRGEEGMAMLDDDCCGNCFQTITSQMVNELLMEHLVLCKNCGCLLYLPEDREPKRKSDSS
jgi:predicted  nucleic acid-binding Zn-ribbon protein